MTTDNSIIERLINSQKWVNNGFLNLPSHLIKNQQARHNHTELDNTMAVCITNKELGNKSYSISKIKNELQYFSIYDCLQFLSKMSIILENDGAFSFNLQAKMLGQILSPELISQIANYLKKTKSKNHVIFSEKQVLWLIKYSILFAKDTPPKDFSDGKDFFSYTKLLIAINDMFQEDVANSITLKSSEDELIKYAIQNLSLSASDQFRYQIGRYIRLFIKIPLDPSIIALPDYIDLNKEFKESTSFDLTEYITIGFSLIVNFVRASLVNNNMQDCSWFITKNTYFKDTNISNKGAERIFNSFCITLSDIRRELNALSSDKSKLRYDNIIFQKYPLLEFKSGQYTPLSLRFLKEKLTSGVYWTLFDYIKTHGGEHLNKFTRYFGNIFEYYIKEIFNRIYPKHPNLAQILFHEHTYHKKEGECKTSDLMIFYADKAIFVEVKSSRLNVTKTAIMGDLDSFKEDVKDIVVQGASQLHRVINDFKNSRFTINNINPKSIKKYYPLLITLDSFPQNFLIWGLINKALVDEGYLQDKDIAPMQIIDSEEIEIIEPLIEDKGINIIDIIADKLSDNSMIFIPMKNFLHYSKYNKYLIKNKYLLREYDEFGKKANEFFFGKGRRANTNHV